MRGLPGLIIAAGLGIVGAICNWAYLARQASQMEKVSFVALKSTAQLNLGDRFKDADLVKVDIPRDNLGNLNEVGISWNNRASVIDMSATKAYRGGEILLWQDLQTPGARDFSELLADNELARMVPVDPRSFVPERVSPGNLISFVIPKMEGADPPRNSVQPTVSSSGTEIIGPFQILSLGSRTGDRDVRLANTRGGGQETLIGIRVRVQDDGRLEPKADRLFQILSLNNSPLQVLLHPASMENKPLP